MSQRILMSPMGHQKLLAELHEYRTVRRPQVVADIEEARSHGDLSENAEYEEAKERQGQIEARIHELETRIAAAVVIDPGQVADPNVIGFGATVELEDEDTGKMVTYRLVGAEEIDARAGMISYDSPIGRALMGRSAGDEVRVEIPSGARNFVVNAIRYA